MEEHQIQIIKNLQIWNNILEVYLLPKIIVFFPAICGFFTSIVLCSGIGISGNDSDTLCTWRGFFGHWMRQSVIALMALAAFYWVLDVSTAQILESDQLKVYLGAFVFGAALFGEPIIKNKLTQRLLVFFIGSRFKLSQQQIDKINNANAETKKDDCN